MTQKQAYYFKEFITTIKPKSLYDIYKNPSRSKVTAWKRIESGCNAVKGFHLTVLTHTSQMFTCAYAYDQGDEVIIAVFTQKNNFDIIVSRTFFDSLESVQKWGEDNA